MRDPCVFKVREDTGRIENSLNVSETCTKRFLLKTQGWTSINVIGVVQQ